MNVWMNRRVIKVLLAATLFAGLCACQATARADFLYVATDKGYFGTINTTTGAFSQIGTQNAAFTDGAGLAFGRNGTLYALTDVGPINFNTVNLTTGAVTVIADTGLHNYNSSDITSYGLAAKSDGSLYAYRGDTSLATLIFQINPASGAPTLVGKAGVTIEGGFQGDGSGHLFATGGNIGGRYPSGDGVYQIDPSSGAGTLLGNSLAGTSYALGFAGQTMYAFTPKGSIYSMNLSNGQGTLVASYDATTFGAIEAAAAPLVGPQAVPEPASLTMLACGIVGLFSYARRRQPKGAGIKA